MQSHEDSGGGGHTSSTLHALIGAASQQAQDQAQRSPHSSSRLFQQQAPTEGLGGARNPSSSAYVHGGVFAYDSGQQGGGVVNTAMEYQSSQARPSHPSLTGAYGKPSPPLSGLPSLPSTDHSYSPFYGSPPSHPALPPVRPASYYAPALPTPEPPALPMVGGCHGRPGNGGADDRQFPFVLPVDHADRNGSMRKVPSYASSPLMSSMDSTHSAVSAALNNFQPPRPSSAMAYNPTPSPSDMHQASPPPPQQYFLDPGAQGGGLGAPRPTLGQVAAAAAASNGATDKAPRGTLVQAHPQGHQTDPESRALAGLLRLGGGAMGGAAVSTAAPSEPPQPSIPPPQPQAPPMQQVPRPALTQDHYIELSKEAWVRGYLEVRRTGVASRGKTLNVLRVWDTYHRLLGTDCSQGLRAEILRAMELESGGATVDTQEDPRRSQILIKKLTDETACYLWVSVVDAQQVYFRANQRFSEMFFSGDELKAHLWEWKLLSGLIWGRVVVGEDLKKFYRAFCEVIFGADITPNNVVVKCRSRGGRVVPCLITIGYHGDRAADTGTQTSTYCARIWPLMGRSLSGAIPNDMPIITLA